MPVIKVLCGSATGQASHHDRGRRCLGLAAVFPDPGGEAVYRLAFAEYFFHYGARLPHGGYRPGRQRDRLTMPRRRDHLSNSQVTSIEADRH
jgi:hypothetical protein